jgi:hypothetical protein
MIKRFREEFEKRVKPTLVIASGTPVIASGAPVIASGGGAYGATTTKQSGLPGVIASGAAGATKQSG